VRVAEPKPTVLVKSGILGHLGRLFGNGARPEPGQNGEAEAEPEGTRFGTPGTGLAKSKVDPVVGTNPQLHESGTPGTPSKNPYAVRKRISEEEEVQCTIKDFRAGVRGVPDASKSGPMERPAKEQVRLPYLMPDGTLVIPFNSPEQFHWWKGGQSVKDTKAEIVGNRAG
jgi:hypothetical protein